MGDCVCPYEVCSIHGDCTEGAVARHRQAVARDAQPHPPEDRSSLPVLMQAQFELQGESFQDIYALDEEGRIEFIRWNVLALEDELHEMLGECGWKPWATSRHINPTPALKELVDALHFFMNLVMAVAGHDESGAPVSPIELGEALGELYFAKREVNARRQAEGYTGLDKCPGCRRDSSFFVTLADTGAKICAGCGAVVEAG